MAARTITQITTSVKDNLGPRSSGSIGTQSQDLVILESINTFLFKLSKKYSLPCYHRNLSFALTAIGDTDNEHAIPTTDSTGATIRIKSIISFSILRQNDTIGRPMKWLSNHLWNKQYPYIDSSTDQGEPAFYTIFADTIIVYPYPDDYYTAYMDVNIWPTRLTSADSDSPQPLGIEWDDVIEEYATYRCFLKLQQLEDAQAWFNLYANSLKDTIAVVDLSPDKNHVSGFPAPAESGQPWLDPLVKE